MGDVNDADVLLLQLAHAVEQALDLVEGEGARGLVEDEDLGVAHEAAQDLDHALLGDGQRHGLALEVHVPAGLLHDLLEALVEDGGLLLEANGDVLANRHVREQHGLLRHHIDAVREGGLRVRDVDLVAIDDDLAGIRRVDAHDDLHERGLAGAVATNQGQNLSVVDLKADALEDRVRTERLIDVVNAQELVAPLDVLDDLTEGVGAALDGRRLGLVGHSIPLPLKQMNVQTTIQSISIQRYP